MPVIRRTLTAKKGNFVQQSTSQMQKHLSPLGSGSSLLEDRIGAQIRPKPPFACKEVIDESFPLTLEETDRQKINSPPGTMFFQEPQS